MCTLSVIVGLQLVRRLGEPVPKWSTGPTFKNPLRFDQQVLSEILLSRSKVGQRPKSVPLSCSSESLQPVPHREKSHHTFDSIVIIRYPCEKIFDVTQDVAAHLVQSMHFLFSFLSEKNVRSFSDNPLRPTYVRGGVHAIVSYPCGQICTFLYGN